MDTPRAVVLVEGHSDLVALRTLAGRDGRDLAAEGHFASGSMGPKVDAVCRFVEQGGQRAVITNLENIVEGVAGNAGTVVVPN